MHIYLLPASVLRECKLILLAKECKLILLLAENNPKGKCTAKEGHPVHFQARDGFGSSAVLDYP